MVSRLTVLIPFCFHQKSRVVIICTKTFQSLILFTETTKLKYNCLQCTIEFNVRYHFYSPQTKLRKGNVFAPVCQSFCSQGGVCLSACKDFPPSRHPWETPPPSRHPTGRPPLPADGHCSGRYASYWNAFLSVYKFTSQPGTPLFQGPNLGIFGLFTNASNSQY